MMSNIYTTSTGPEDGEGETTPPNIVLQNGEDLYTTTTGPEDFVTETNNSGYARSELKPNEFTYTRSESPLCKPETGEPLIKTITAKDIYTTGRSETAPLNRLRTAVKNTALLVLSAGASCLLAGQSRSADLRVSRTRTRRHACGRSGDR